MRQKTDFSAMRRKLDDALLALAAYRETKAILNLDKAPAGAVLLRLVDNLKKIFLLDRVPAKKLAVVALTDPNATISLPVLKIITNVPGRARSTTSSRLLSSVCLSSLRAG